MKSSDTIQYLTNKTSVDDRALNARVWAKMVQELQERKPPRRVLEAGAGIGTMFQRLLERNVLAQTYYKAIDTQSQLIAHAKEQLAEWLPILNLWEVTLSFEKADVYEFVGRDLHTGMWDMVIANAFLDLVDMPALLPQLFNILKPNALFYFTINFDGETILEPIIEPAFDSLITRLYHRTMDERVVVGRPAGHSRTGRQLFHQIEAAGGEILAAGSSDWVVYANAGTYPHNEAAFLHHIIDTIAGALTGHEALDAGKFAAWVKKRHTQIEAGELVYIAHQLDILGKMPAEATK